MTTNAKKTTNAKSQHFDTDRAVQAAMTRVLAMDTAEGQLAVETQAYSRMLRESIYTASAAGGQAVVSEYLNALAVAQYDHYSEMAGCAAVNFDYGDVVRLLRTRIYAPLARFTRAHEAFNGVCYSFDVSVTRDKAPTIAVNLAVDAERKTARGKNGGRSKAGQQDTKQTRKADVEHAASMLPVTEQLSAAQAVFQHLNSQQKKAFTEWFVGAQSEAIEEIQKQRRAEKAQADYIKLARTVTDEAKRETRNRKRREKHAAKKLDAFLKQQEAEAREKSLESRA